MDYIKRENIKFVVGMIALVLIGLLIAGYFDKTSEDTYNKGYKEGYQQALDDYGIDE